MNCDQAFELLTDSGQPSSEELNRHIAECPRCREMAEVLSPALSRLSSYSGPEEAPECVSPSAGVSFLSAEAIQTADSLARELERRSRRKSSAGFLERARYVVIACVTVICLLVLWGSPRFSAAPGDTSRCLWKSPPRPLAAGSPAAAGESESLRARQLVLTCMACHVSISPAAR